MSSIQLKESYHESTISIIRRNVRDEQPAKKPKRISHLFFREILALALIISLFLYFTKEEFTQSLPHGGELQSQYSISKLKRLDSVTLAHKVRQGETLASIMTGYGFSPVLPNKLDTAIKNLKSKGVSPSLKIGQEIKFALSENASFPSIELPIDPARKAIFFEEEGEYASKFFELPLIKEQVEVSGEIESSFAQAIDSQGISYALIDDLVDLFSSSINFHKDFRQADGFKLIYQKQKLANGTLVKDGPIVAAMIEVNKTPYYAVRFVGEDRVARYYNEKGEPLGNFFLRYPLQFSRISSYFSKARFHPVLKSKRAHNGVDFAAKTGTPVRSVADGTVTYAGWKGPNGQLIKIQHGSRYSTAYAHLSKISRGIRRGTTVRRGQVIGAVGATGRATGPHLHYAFYDNGRFVDPLKIKLPSLVTDKTKIDQKYLDGMLKRLEPPVIPSTEELDPAFQRVSLTK